MARYSIGIKPSAVKELEAIASRDRKRIVARIQGLAADPRPPGVEKLSGAEKYRIRQGSCRVLYTLDDEVEEVVVVKIGHRKDVYR